MAGDMIHFNTVKLLELSELETSKNHSAAKGDMIHFNTVNLHRLPDMMRNFVYFNNENPSEVSGLASFDNHIVAKIMIAEGIYANIFENTGSISMEEDLIYSNIDNLVEMLFVNANELETGVEFATHEEAQKSLISKFAVKREPDLNFEKVNQVAVQIVLNDDKITHESVVDI
nr:hypothetical protein [Tanacetum cinerariifolium]